MTPFSIHGYTLGAELGRGAIGVVYAATHDATGSEVASGKGKTLE